jgi:hypothetical protein
MKLTTKKLRQIIQEEIKNTFSEAERGDLGNYKRQRKYGSRDIGDIYVSPAEGGSLVSLEKVLDELDAHDLDISKTRLGWHAVVYSGSEDELREEMAQDSALAALIGRLYNARQRIIERYGSTTSRTVYPFRDRGREENGLNVKVNGDEVIVMEM